MAISKLMDDLAIISKLGDNPNTDDNLTADELKAKFDAAVLIIQEYLNNRVVPELNTTSLSVTQKLNKSGGRMTGGLSMDGHPLSDVPTPTEDSHAANKAYVDQVMVDVAGFSGKHKDLKGLDDADQHPMAAIKGLADALGGKANQVHNHDGRYYTETEVNNLLVAYAKAIHGHSAADVGALAITGGKLTGALTLGGHLILTEGVNYGTEEQRPAPGVRGRIYFRKVGK